MVNDLTTRLLHCITEREGMNDVGRNQFRVTFDHFRRPRLEPFLMSNNINNDVFTAPDETINRTQQVTLSNADIGDNDNNVKIGTQWVPSVSPTSDKKTVTEGENVNVGAGPSDVGGDNNKHHGDAEKQGDGSTSDGDDVNIEINMHIDDDDNKRDGKGDVTSRSTFQRIKHALMHMRKNMKDKIVQLRMSEYIFHFSKLFFLFFLFHAVFIYPPIT
jgi:hypothetical protein